MFNFKENNENHKVYPSACGYMDKNAINNGKTDEISKSRIKHKFLYVKKNA